MCNSCYVCNRYRTVPGARERADVRAAAWRRDNPERARAISQKSRGKACPVKKRDRALRKKYGITVDDYVQMLAEQSGRCQICEMPPAAGKMLHVDHCHESGRVRGLLCNLCNWYLGKLDANPRALARLLEYCEPPEDDGSA